MIRPVRPITGDALAPTLGSSSVTTVRLLLLALVVTDLLVPASMSLSSSAVAVAASEDAGCACCSFETETAAPRAEPTLRLPSEPHDVAAASAPITAEHVRLPFRPPMAA